LGTGAKKIFKYDAGALSRRFPARSTPTVQDPSPMTIRDLRTAALSVLLGLAFVASSGCVYRLSILQGNFLTSKDLDRVQVGMTRVQVRALLGTPMVADPFQTNRWDYVYYYDMAKLKQKGTRQFTVFFQEDKVVKIDRSDGGAMKDTVDPPTEAQS
jgi:outer membrane protein assembly factor BamE